MKSHTIAALLLIASCALPMPASAHKASDSYLTLTRADSDAAAISGRWDIALRDLDNAITLDTNGDGDISWGEVRAKHASIADYALSRLTIESSGAACTITAGEQLVEQHSDGAYTVLLFSGHCPRPGAALAVDYRLLFDIDPQHRGLLQYVENGAVQSVIFGVDSHRQTIGGAETGRFEQLRQCVRDGVWHIWLGFDHILFLLSLLLPAVLVRRGSMWLPATSLGAVAIDVAKVVTAFTIAHSITLTLAALGLVSPNARWIESGIALSVVLAALNNVFPLVRHGRWVAAFGFGLIHGCGFASALKDLGLPTGSLAISLFGFNVGVELGQLAIVAVFLPVAFALRGTWTYRRGVLAGGSMAIAAIASIWLIERAFNLALPGLAFAG
ncbi:MAG TPA: HupE/UreJ family protein [Casimicrobiaceae bacterium]|nr:HupE/UreJ family protein [Casimicrobiaceae bacterium]